MNRKIRGFLTFFGVFWSAMTLLFDGFMVGPALRQLRALNYSTTQGIIVSSEVTHSEDSEGGPTHGVSVRYTYVVNDQQYTGTRYRYDTSSSSDSKWAYEVVAAHPPGSNVKVYFHPAQPQDSVLATGLEGSDLFHLAFMTPFNAVMLAFWWGAWLALRDRFLAPAVAGGVKIMSGMKQIRVRLTSWSPVATFIATSALLAFLTIFVVGFAAGGFHPSVATMKLAWLLIFGGGIAAGLIHWLRAISGKYDLIIDQMNRTIELPATQGRKARRRLSSKEINGITVQIVQQPSTGDGESSPMYAPALHITGTNAGCERLAQWLDQKKAERFAEWLRGQLGLSVQIEQKTKSLS